MLSCAYLSAFLLLGVLSARRLFGMFSRQVGTWLGLALGMVEMMWLPSLYAFKCGFTLKAQWWALGTAAFICLASCLMPRVKRGGNALLNIRSREVPAKLVLWLVVPLLLLSAYLQYTHTLMPDNGALDVGQSTYGDLCLHLGIATGLKNARFPPEYTILPGTALGYPFLFDALSSSMLLLGCDLAWAFIIPGVIAMGLVYWGFALLAWEITRDRRAVVIAFLLTFLNGGMGFVYVLDGLPSDWSKLYECLFGFYRAPANMPDYNLRWVNVVCDLMIPQRTLLAGWTTVLPALYMLVRAVKTNSRRIFVTLGCWAGLMPMIHTHSFLALGLISLGCMIACVISEKDRRAYAVNFTLYGLIAAALAAGQLIEWTFPQSLGSGSIKLWFNWVNNDNGRLIDGYFWFWIKNAGPVYILLLPAAVNAPKRIRYLAWGCLTVYLAAEFVQFQPNIYDNNKLFCVAFLLMTPMVGKLLALIWDAMKNIRLRGIVAAVFMTVCLLSGALSLARETLSNYTLFSASEVEAAKFIDENFPGDCVILTSTQHNNAPAVLAGRKIVCGTPSYLFYHGVDYSRREDDVCDMYENPADSWELFAKYDVMYIYISSYEAGNYDIDYDTLFGKCDLAFDNDFVKILALKRDDPAANPG